MADRSSAFGIRFDSIPFGKSGSPEAFDKLLPYRWGFGVDTTNPVEPDLTEPVRFLSLLRDLDIRMVNITAGSPYYNPHIQRPALAAHTSNEAKEPWSRFIVAARLA